MRQKATSGFEPLFVASPDFLRINPRREPTYLLMRHASRPRDFAEWRSPGSRLTHGIF